MASTCSVSGATWTVLSRGCHTFAGSATSRLQPGLDASTTSALERYKVKFNDDACVTTYPNSKGHWNFSSGFSVNRTATMAHPSQKPMGAF
ncbi:MAG: hypothetical protein WA997_14730 [Anaerolineales bacterium]|nr:hypothetical protein [Anaerolineales bacterium]